MPKSDTHPDFRCPELTKEHILGSRSGEASPRPPQQLRIPDLYQRVLNSPHPTSLVRYRVKIDSSYLDQSSAVAELWSGHGQGWVELAQIYVGREFYTIPGPNKDALDPSSREISKFLDWKRAGEVAISWQKIIKRLSDEATLVLRLIHGA